MKEKQRLYRVIFLNHEHRYEVYAQEVNASAVPGFVEVASLVFDESPLVNHGEEEPLKEEFGNVVRTLIPVHAVLRVDEVNKKGIAKVVDLGPRVSNVHYFPNHFPPQGPQDEG